jgi:hypothetical protein
MFTSHPAANEILRVPGYLFWNPSALTNESTWGTKLGFCEKGVDVDFRYLERKLTGEIFGSEWTHDIFLGVNIEVKVVLKNYNTTTVGRLFPGLTSGTSVQFPNSFATGKDLTRYSIAWGRLLFVPEDTTNNPIFILQKAIPNFRGTFPLSRVRDTSFPCVFSNFRKSDSIAGMYYFGLITGGVLA